MLPDVIQWHHDEITELPAGAVLLAASTRYPHQAFRLGDRAWGLQFHIECDPAMIADWAKRQRDRARRAGHVTRTRWSRRRRGRHGRRGGGVAAVRRPVRRAGPRRAGPAGAGARAGRELPLLGG